MAKVTVENAIVDRVFETQYGVGVAVHEEFEGRDGVSGRSHYTLWFDQLPPVEVGQRISASGFLNARARSYDHGGEQKWTADVSVRKARLIQSAPPIAPAPTEEQF